MHADKNGLNKLSGDVICRAFTVLDTLGAGFLEKVHMSVSQWFRNADDHGRRLKSSELAEIRSGRAMLPSHIVTLPMVDVLW